MSNPTLSHAKVTLCVAGGVLTSATALITAYGTSDPGQGGNNTRTERRQSRNNADATFHIELIVIFLIQASVMLEYLMRQTPVRIPLALSGIAAAVVIRLIRVGIDDPVASTVTQLTMLLLASALIALAAVLVPSDRPIR